jgi:hypothetical protein
VKRDVSEATRQKTDKCWRGFVCLSGDGTLCPVTNCVSDLVFVQRTTQAYCPYDVTFGFSHICSCPVRREIYQRYGE